MKNWQLIFVSVLIAVLSLCSAGILNEYGLGKSMWDKAGMVLSFLGVVITIGAAIPVISGLLSYQVFLKNAKEADEALTKNNNKVSKLDKKIKEKENKLSKLLENLGDIYTTSKRAEEQLSALYLYVTEDKPLPNNESTWFFKGKNVFSLDYILLSKLARSKSNEEWAIENRDSYGSNEFDENIVLMGIDILPDYFFLAKLSPEFVKVYRKKLNSIFERFLKIDNPSVNLMIRVKTLVFDIIRNDEFFSFNFKGDEELNKLIFSIKVKLAIDYSELEKSSMINWANVNKNRMGSLFLKEESK